MDFPFENYERMADFMRRCKGKVMVRINDHPGIRRVFEGFYFETIEIRIRPLISGREELR